MTNSEIAATDVVATTAPPVDCWLLSRPSQQHRCWVATITVANAGSTASEAIGELWALKGASS